MTISIEDLTDPDPSFLTSPEIDEIEGLFKNSVVDGIFQCESFLSKTFDYSSFDELKKYLTEHCVKYACQKAWTTTTLAIQCRDCCKSVNSIICLKCFNQGNHEGHRYFLLYSGSGNCDCGDPLLWKHKGFCCHHSSPPAHPEQSGELTSACVSAIKVVVYAAIKWIVFTSTVEDSPDCALTWLIDLISLGDSIRRCAALAMTHIEFYEIISHFKKYDYKSAELFIDFLGHLVSDNTFRLYLSQHIITNLPLIADQITTLCAHSNSRIKESALPAHIMQMLTDFFFHAFFNRLADVLIPAGLFSWVDSAIRTLELMYEQVKKGLKFRVACSTKIFNFIMYVDDLVQSCVMLDKEGAFVVRFSNFLDIFEGNYMYAREVGDKTDDLDEAITLVWHLSEQMDVIVESLRNKGVYNNHPMRSIYEADPFLHVTKMESGFEMESILQPTTQFSIFLPKHILAFNLLMGDDGKLHAARDRCIEPMIREIAGNDYDEFVIRFSVWPVRYMAVTFLSALGYFVRNPNTLVTCVQCSMQRARIKTTFIKIFSMIQAFLGISKDKDRFIRMLAHTFGIYDKGSEACFNLFAAFFHLLACLVFDRACLSRDFFLLRRLHYISLLRLTPLRRENLSWISNDQTDERFIEDFASYAYRTNGEGGSTFRLKDGSDWHPLLILEPTALINSILYNIFAKNPGSLVPFPPFEKELYGLELFSVLTCPVVLALEYVSLKQASLVEPSSEETLVLNYVLNMLLAAANASGEQEQLSKPREVLLNDGKLQEKNQQYIKASSIDDLEKELKGVPFVSFFFAKIDINISATQKSSNDPLSVFEILQRIGPLGFCALDRLGIPYEKPPSVEDNNAEKKKRAQKLKGEIIRSFTSMQESFNGELDVGITTKTAESVCSFCQMQDEAQNMVYPGYVLMSPLPSLAETRTHGLAVLTPPRVTAVFCACVHPLHSACVANKENYVCPIDRIPKNCFIPFFDVEGPLQRGAPLPENVVACITELMVRTFDGDCKKAVESYEGELIQTEVRFRHHLSVLDNPKTKIILRNIFLTIYHSDIGSKIAVEASGRVDSEEGIEEEESELQRLITSFVAEDILTHTVLAGHVRRIYGTIIDKERGYEFLRRVALIDHFVLDALIPSSGAGSDMNPAESNNEKRGFIDWDKLLSLGELKEHFSITPEIGNKRNENEHNENEHNENEHNENEHNENEHNENSKDHDKEIVLRCFSFIDLPHNYVDINKYVVDISQHNPNLFYDLLTGEVLSNQLGNADFIYDYTKRFYSDSFGVFLLLNGERATQPFIFVSRNKRFYDLKPIYVNAYGDEDPGFHEGTPLTLSEDKVAKLAEFVLSYSWLEFCES